MAAHNQAERTQLARIAAHIRWAHTDDPAANTAAARAAFLERFEREVDPQGTLPPHERVRRAEHARKAYFQRLALRSARSRAAKTTTRRNAPDGGGPDAA
jgi:hypothetical protein